MSLYYKRWVLVFFLPLLAVFIGVYLINSGHVNTIANSARSLYRQVFTSSHHPAAPASTESSAEQLASNYYMTDSNGNPFFFVGYHAWASVDPDSYIDQPSKYADMIKEGANYDINYIRISLGVNRFSGSSNPPSWDGQSNTVPFRYEGGKANLDQWDSEFWEGLRYHIELAQDPNGDGNQEDKMMVHVSIFDAVSLRGGPHAYRWNNSYWNIDNQTSNFYGDIDTNNNDSADEGNDFYRVDDFVNNTGIGKYQRMLIDKVIAETGSYDNVFYEVGNELFGSPTDWNKEVITYIKTKTDKPITQNQGAIADNIDGWAQHRAGTPAQVKENVADITGNGYPAWEDPDGPVLIRGSADDLRRSAWYSFAGGAAGWGGFSEDFWGSSSDFNTQKAEYYQYLLSFVEDSGVNLSTLVPQNNLVGNNGENSLVATIGTEYVAYILNDSQVDIDLGGLSGSATVQIYDPKTGDWINQSNVSGGGDRTFNRPSGLEDWVILIQKPGGTSATPTPSPTNTPIPTSTPITFEPTDYQYLPFVYFESFPTGSPLQK